MAVFLFTPGSEVIGALLLNAWDRGGMGVLAAFASVQILVTAVFLVGMRLICRGEDLWLSFVVDGLVKTYGAVRAVDDVSFVVREGSS